MKSNGEPIFLVGEHGQAIIEVIGGPHQENFKCCDQPMGLLLANETDGAKGKASASGYNKRQQDLCEDRRTSSSK